MANLARYVVRLEAETTKYRKELQKANKQLSKFGADQKRTLNRMDSAFRKAGRSVRTGFTAALTAAGVGLSIGFAKQVTDVAAQLDDFAIRLGIGAKELQVWQLAAATAGLNTNQFNLALQRVSRRAAEAEKGLGEAKDALKTLGIDAATFNRLSLDNRILDLAKAFEAVGSDSEKLALAFKLFDSEGTAVLQFLKEGEEGLIKLREYLSGQVWSDEERQKLKEANKQLTLLSSKFTLLAGDVSAFLLGAGNDFLDWLDELQASAAGTKVETFFKNLGRAFSGQATVGAPRSGGGVELTESAAARLGDLPGRATSLGKGGRVGGIAPGITFRQGEGTTSKAEAAGVTAALFGRFDEQKKKLAEIEATRKKAFEQEMKDTQEGQAVFKAIADERKQQIEDQAQAFGDLFVNNLVQAQEVGFKALLEGWGRTLAQMVARAAAVDLFGSLFPAGAGGGGLGGIIGGLFGRANGGAVAAGTPYMVGERGPEMFIPNTSGRIKPNANGGVNINQTLNVQGASRTEFAAAAAALKDQTKAEVMDMLRRGR